MEIISNKVGRPRRENLTSTINFTVDPETAEAIRALASEKSISQSDIMRELTPVLSSKNYETLVPLLGLEHLQKISEKCWSDLHTQAAIFPVEEISNFMPAFVTTWEPPQVHVKYPTYKIDVYNNKNNAAKTSTTILNELAKDICNRSEFYNAYPDYIIKDIKDNKMPNVNYNFISEVMCLSPDLNINQETKNNIVKILFEKGYEYSVYPAYCLRTTLIDLLDEGKYFRVKTV